MRSERAVTKTWPGDRVKVRKLVTAGVPLARREGSEMELTSEAIRGAEFNPAWKGYSPIEVDAFMDQVADGVETLHAKIRELSNRPAAETVAAVATAPTEEAVKRTLRLAQRAADLVVSEAKASAERTAEESNQKSARIISDAEVAAARRLQDANDEAERLIAHRLELFEQDHTENMHRLAVERADLEAGLAAQRGELVRVKGLVNDTRSRLIQTLKDQLSRVDEVLPST